MANPPITEATLARIRSMENLDLDPEKEHSESLIRMRQDRHRRFDEARAAFKTLAGIVNCSSGDQILRAALVEEMASTHRYLQQGLIEELLGGLGDLGGMMTESPARWSDGRNEVGMRWLVRLRETFKEDLFWR